GLPFGCGLRLVYRLEFGFGLGFELEFVDALLRGGCGLWHHPRAPPPPAPPRAARSPPTDPPPPAARPVRATELDRHRRLMGWGVRRPVGERSAALAIICVGFFGMAQCPVAGAPCPAACIMMTARSQERKNLLPRILTSRRVVAPPRRCG